MKKKGAFIASFNGWVGKWDWLIDSKGKEYGRNQLTGQIIRIEKLI